MSGPIANLHLATHAGLTDAVTHVDPGSRPPGAGRDQTCDSRESAGMQTLAQLPDQDGGAAPRVREIAARYPRSSGRVPLVFDGPSSGAAAFGTHTIITEETT
jgi:hypothetical protein